MDTTDSTLVEQARRGDGDAFAAIYDRYADRIHSFCIQSLRDRDDAADATQDTFVKAARGLGQLRDPARLRAWLFSIARNEIANRGRARARTVAHDDFSDLEADVADPIDGIAGAELRALVWAAAESLTERDRQLLDLQLREELEGAEMAQIMEVEPPHLHVMVSRMRDRIEKAMGTLLVARVGRDDCAELDRLLTGWDGRFTVEVRSKVTRHVESCEVCDDRRRGLAVAPMFSPALFVVPAPADLRRRVLAAAEPILAAAAGTTSWARRIAVAVGIAAAIALVGVPLLLAARGGSETAPIAIDAPVPTTTVPITESSAPISAAPSTAPAPTTPPATAPPATSAPPPPPPTSAGWGLSTNNVDFGATEVSQEVVLTNVGGSEGSWTAATDGEPFTVSPVSGTLAPGASVELTINVDRSGLAEQTLSATLTISGESTSATASLRADVEVPPTLTRLLVTPPTVCVEGSARVTTVTVSAMASDDSGLESVIVTWSNGSQPLPAAGGDTYLDDVGPFATVGTESLTVTATDTRGNTTSAATSVEVRTC